jgi:hypothetical protein
MQRKDLRLGTQKQHEYSEHYDSSFAVDTSSFNLKSRVTRLAYRFLKHVIIPTRTDRRDLC